MFMFFQQPHLQEPGTIWPRCCHSRIKVQSSHTLKGYACLLHVKLVFTKSVRNKPFTAHSRKKQRFATQYLTS